VSFLTRRPEELDRAGYSVYEDDAPSVNLILDTVPELRGSEHAYKKQLEKLREGQGNIPLIHISTTSVYGKQDEEAGEPWPAVRESSPPAPDSDSARRRLELEMNLQRWWPEVWIIRSSGIYGRRRALPLQIKSGNLRRLSSGNRITSRIHVVDLLRLALRFWTQKEIKLLNAVDRQPSANKETFTFLEELLDIRLPGDWRTASLKGRMVQSLYLDRIMDSFAFPTFQEGFRDAMAAHTIEG